MPIDSHAQVQISEIIDTVTDQTDGHGYLGFIVTYPGGRIVNKVLEYNRDNHDQIHSRIVRMHRSTLVYHRLREMIRD